MHDLIVWVLFLGRVRSFQIKLFNLAGIRDGESVLACGGSGKMTTAAKELVGDDGGVVAIDEAAEVLAFDDASFDVAFALGVLHHFSDEQLDGYLHEIRRVLRPRGRIFSVGGRGVPLDYVNVVTAFERNGFTAIERGSIALPALSGMLFGRIPFASASAA